MAPQILPAGLMHAKSFRPEIEGLRAVAILLVLFFHAGLPVPGGYVGVDVFFVISGFLITSLLLREAASSHTISLLGFYARRAKRLLPASFLVLLVTALLVAQFTSGLEQVAFGWDIAAAAGYVANWRFVATFTDYLAEDNARSPVLHFWSLAVEEQFYFLWPLFILAATRLAQRHALSLQKCAAGVLALIVLPSFVCSVWLTRQDQNAAFFSTATRLWELGCGAYLALGVPWLERRAKSWAAVLGAAGWLLLGASAAYFNAHTQWPGAAALAPVIGTSCLIASATIAQQNFTIRPLLLRPMVALGGISYSLYLWHWPILVAGVDFFHLKGPLYGALLAASSIVPAWLSYRFVEQPFRSSVELNATPKYAVSLGVNLSLAGVLLGFSTVSRVDTTQLSTNQIKLNVRGKDVLLRPADWGAGALGDNPNKSAAGRPSTSQSTLIPLPQFATADVPVAYKRNCQLEFEDTKLRWCKIGDPHGKVDTVVVGDSKILQYFEALDAVGQALGLRIRTATKSACPFSAASVTHDGKPYPECDQVNAELLEEFDRNPPDLLITSQRERSGSMPGEDGKASLDDMVRGLVSHWSTLEGDGTEVIVLLDNPRPPGHVYKCVLEHPRNHEQCAFPREEAIAESGAPVQLAAEKLLPSVDVIDLTDYICPQHECAPVIGSVLIYRQGSHITNSYIKTLAPELLRQLKRLAQGG